MNDTFGHPAGDRVLQALSALMRRRLRPSDTVGRFGGEEFALLVEDMDESDALRLVDRIREEFAALKVAVGGGGGGGRSSRSASAPGSPR